MKFTDILGEIEDGTGPSSFDSSAELQSNDGRDRALDFHWHVPEDAVFRTGWLPTSNVKYNLAMCSVMAALVVAHRASIEWVSYSRRKEWYSDPERYRGLPYSYTRILSIVDELLKRGLIEEVRARPGDHIRTKLQSKMRATSALANAFEGVRLSYDPIEIIRLKDKDGRLIDYRETDETRRMRKELRAINDALGDIVIELPAECRQVGDRIEVGGLVLRQTPTPLLYRVFNRARWDAGGRLYWWGQNLPAGIRLKLLINGEPVVERDYSALHPRMLYARRGCEMPEDPYTIPEFPRPFCKRALLVALNAKSQNECVSALMNTKEKSQTIWPYNRAMTIKLLEALIEHNSPIRDDIASDVGIGLMYDDSKIAVAVVKTCLKAGFPCLPIHDSFVVPRSRGTELRQFMDSEFLKYSAMVRPKAKAGLALCVNDENSIPGSTEENSIPGSTEKELGAGPASTNARRSHNKVRSAGVKRSARSAVHRSVGQASSTLWSVSRPYDFAEAQRRQKALIENSSADYFPVPGEVEVTFWLEYGSKWVDILEQIEVEDARSRHFGPWNLCPRIPTLEERQANKWLSESTEPRKGKTFDRNWIKMLQRRSA